MLSRRLEQLQRRPFLRARPIIQVVFPKHSCKHDLEFLVGEINLFISRRVSLAYLQAYAFAADGRAEG
jgi:hypothetical protein